MESPVPTLFLKGLIKRVGTGDSIPVWNDPWIPGHRPRSATSKTIHFDPSLTVSQLIDHNTHIWDEQLIRRIIEPEDAELIIGLPISRFLRPDSVGWHYTKSGKYSVKSGYHTEREFPDKEDQKVFYGPDFKRLQEFCWKLKCPPKIRHFIWQAISGCISVTKNLQARGIKCDTRCVKCGADVETINHVLFECPPALQTWALSLIPSPPGIFPLSSVYANMDYLFWRVPSHNEMAYYPWIIWYIWKSRNDKLYSNIDRDPRDILKLAEGESLAWEAAQSSALTVAIIPDTHPEVSDEIHRQLNIQGRWCFLDGSWKKGDKYAGQGWYSIYEGERYILMGARNIRCSLSPLHAEFEALIWAMECMMRWNQREVTFATDCSELMKIVSTPAEWPAFLIYLDEYENRKSFFTRFVITHTSRANNTKADALARGARVQPSYFVYVNADPPSWLSATR